MILRPLLPDAGAAIDTAAPDARERLVEIYTPPRRPWLRLNLIVSVDGSARDAGGTSDGLSSRADRAILGAIRAVSDTVLVGAATIRAEGSLVPKHAHLTILTRSGDFTGAELPTDIAPGRILIAGPRGAEAVARRTFAAAFEFLELPDVPTGGRMPVAELVASLRSAGREAIVCEGGPELGAALLDAGLVDEICLSTSPRLLGGGFPVLGTAARSEVPLRLAGLLADDAGGLYARWRLDRD